MRGLKGPLHEIDTFTVPQLARACRVHYRTALRWVEKGLIESYRLPGGKGPDRRFKAARLITRAAVLDFMRREYLPTDLVERPAGASRLDAPRGRAG